MPDDKEDIKPGESIIDFAKRVGSAAAAQHEAEQRAKNVDKATLQKTGQYFFEFKKGGSTNWIQGAIKKPGSLRESLGVKKGEKIPAKKLTAAAKKPGLMGKRARLAETLKGFKK
jgi:hypothetical protein